MAKIIEFSLVRNPDSHLPRPSVSKLKAQVAQQAEAMITFAVSPPVGQKNTFKAFEEALGPMVFALARTVVTLFLTASEQRVAAQTPARQERRGRMFRKAPAIARNLETTFGVVRQSSDGES